MPVSGEERAGPGDLLPDGSIDMSRGLRAAGIIESGHRECEKRRDSRSSHNSMRLEVRFTMCVINNRDSSISESPREADSCCSVPRGRKGTL